MAYDPLSLLAPRRLPVSSVDEYAQSLLGYQRTDPLSGLSGMPDMTDTTLLRPTQQVAQQPRGFLAPLQGMLTGPGSSARLQALGAALLSGPSRTPISFGSQLAKGLLAGTQLAEEQKEAELQRSLLRQEKMDPDYKRVNVGGDDVLIDTNPYSETFQQVISPQTGVSDATSVKPVQIIPTESEIRNAPLPEDVAQGDLYGAMARGVRGVAGIFGKEASKETTRAEYFVENLNKDLRLNLVQDLGGRLTKVVSDELNKILPNPLQDNNTEFIVKAEELVDFSEKRIAEINSQLPNMTSKERKEAVNLINNLSSKIRSYKAMLEKQRQFDTSSGIYAKEQKTNQQLLEEYQSLGVR